MMACHCTECQKLATAPYSVTAAVLADDIEFSGEMKEWRRSADSGNINAARFCPSCGNRIYHYNPAESHIIKLKLKPIDPEAMALFEPKAHIWVKEKQEWVKIPEGVPAFDTVPN
ncbi:gfa-like protein [Vibrio ishigakensis]|uniref:Gfa-like protein n=1 Tax=Vibrio ishigakensis TaxID=1481914 RepID=A0A0B8QCL5_9VIBR|nr:gfa-like protein [Vibrio ishigakensis]